MGMFVNSGNGAFQVALNSEIYVDKSGLLKYTNRVMNTLQGYICNSRPRRFGKSITANMLNAYYSRGCDSEEMFSNLEISKSPDFKDYCKANKQFMEEKNGEGGTQHESDYVK